MIVVLAIAAAVLIAGRYFAVSRRVQISLLVVLFVAVFFFQLTLPEGNSLREATGGSAKNWVIVAALGALVWGYRTWLRWLRARHDDGQATVSSDLIS